MTSLYIFCAVFGGIGLLAQAFFHHDDGSGHDFHDLHEGVKLPSLRALTAAVTFFGLIGGWLEVHGWPGLVAAPPALVAGGIIGYAVNTLIRRVARFERNASLDLGEAVLEHATVYIPIHPDIAGKILVNVRDRTIELEATTATGRTLATGEQVEILEIYGDVALVRPLKEIA